MNSEAPQIKSASHSDGVIDLQWSDGQRWMQWVQIERGDFHSSLRILADRLGLARDARPLLKGAYGQSCSGRYK